MKTGRIIVHALLIIYALILAFVVGGLIFKYIVPVDIFFDLSFALLFFALAQCVYELGARQALNFFVVTCLIGFAVEILGANTGLPFGKYSYGNKLGGEIFGVPIVVPLIWFVISYIVFSLTFPSYTIKQAVKDRPFSKINYVIVLISLASFGAVAWDLLVDPMFSQKSYGYWTWQTNSALNLSGVPVSNFIGWFVVAFGMISIFALFLFRPDKQGTLIQRKNTWDSRISYILLLIDAAVANQTLGQYLVIGIGAVSMSLFLFLTFVVSRPRMEQAKFRKRLRQMSGEF